MIEETLRFAESVGESRVLPVKIKASPLAAGAMPPVQFAPVRISLSIPSPDQVIVAPSEDMIPKLANSARPEIDIRRRRFLKIANVDRFISGGGFHAKPVDTTGQSRGSHRGSNSRGWRKEDAAKYLRKPEIQGFLMLCPMCVFSRHPFLAVAAETRPVLFWTSPREPPQTCKFPYGLTNRKSRPVPLAHSRGLALELRECRSFVSRWCPTAERPFHPGFALTPARPQWP